MSVRVDSPVPSTLGCPFRSSIQNRSSSVRRRLLFPDSQESSAPDVGDWLRDEIAKAQREGEQRWNFDFTNNSPRQGQLKWKALREAEVPTTYLPAEVLTPSMSRLTQQEETLSRLKEADSSSKLQKTVAHDESCSVRIETTPPSDVGKEVKELPVLDCSSCKPVKRGRDLTDFFPAKKPRL